MNGVIVLLVALVVAAALGGLYAWRNGRFRDRPRASASASAGAVAVGRVDLEALDASLGERATLLQFSSAFCSPCRATRAILSDVAALTPGVVHVEVDAESHLELVRELGIMRTPTVLVLDAQGVERRRASGLPTKDQVLTAVADAV